MKRKITAVLIFSALALCMTGCGSSKKETEAASSEPTVFQNETEVMEDTEEATE